MGPDVHGGPVTAGLPSSGRPRRERADPLVAAVVFALFARTFLFQAFAVPSPSMEKTVLTGDRLLVNRFLYAPFAGPWAALFPGRAVRRGDVLVFRFPGDPRRDFIKRVVGLPGETIAIRDRAVSIDGRRLEEPYVFHADDRVWPDDPDVSDEGRRRDQLAPLRVPDGAYFVMGDNRDDSSDSRTWGPVPRSHLVGRALLVYWSIAPRPTAAAAPPPLAAIRDAFTRMRWDRAFLPVR
jgi:signal peptidase I